MIISVISPHAKNNGNTTLAMLVAMESADSGKLTCITHINSVSNSFYRYLNFIGFQDKTSSPSQIVKILREGSISDADITDYCKKVSENLEAFTNNATNFSQEDMNFMLDYIAKSFPHDNVVFDVDTTDLSQNMMVVNLSDVVVLNITQSVSELQEFFNRKDEYIKLIGKKPLIVVLNKYNSIKGTIKETANWMGIKKPNNWLVLHENPWITWATNNGKLNMLYNKIKAKDDRVIEIKPDLTKIYFNLIKAKAAKDKRFGGRE